MQKRLSILRNDIVTRMDSAIPGKKDFENKMKDLSVTVTAITCPCFDVQEETISLLPRQYVCCKNALRDMIDGRMEDAWWEIYDFVSADQNEELSFAEMGMLCMMFELYLEKYRKKNGMNAIEI